MGASSSNKEYRSKILKGVKVALKHFVFDFDDDSIKERSDFQPK